MNTGQVSRAIAPKLCASAIIFLATSLNPMCQLLAQQSSAALKRTPIVDGEKEPIWNQVPPISVRQLVVDQSNLKSGQQPATANVYCLWDSASLYILAEVADADVSNAGDAPWDQDSIEIFLDERKERSTSYDANDWHYRIGQNGSVSCGRGGGEKLVNTAVKKTPTGYRVEARIEFSEIKPRNGSQIGFEIQVNNNPGQGSRNAITKWNEASNESWRNPSGFGTLAMFETEKEIQQFIAANPATDHPSPQGKTDDGSHHERAPVLEISKRVPAWAKDAVFYQIFPERFRNGDPSNDPTIDSLEFRDIMPDSWRVTRWTKEWYARDAWETEMGADFFEDGVFHRRYGGDLQGVIDKLDYLKDLGINTLYMNPVFYARSLHKYDGNSFHHVDPHFGPDPRGDFELMSTETSDPKSWKWTAADKLFLKLVQEVHRRDMRIIIDGVFNHTGRDFFAFADIAKNGKESPYTDWYVVHQFDDPATKQNEFKYQCWWGVDTLPEFADNADGTDLHPKPKAYVFDSTRRWMDPNGDGDPSDGIDGWRLDVANEVPNKFWQDWNVLVRELNPDAYTVSEIWEDAANYLEDCGFSATMNYHAFSFMVKGFLIDNRMPASRFAKEVSERLEAHPKEVRHALQNLIDSHDTDRVASMIVNAKHKYPYVKQDRYDYDVGERVSPRHFPKYDISAPTQKERQVQKLVALFQMTFVGAPMVYYGTEAGMDGADDPCDRMPMVWEDLEYEPRTVGPRGNKVTKTPIQFQPRVFKFYQDMIQLRSNQPPLRSGELEFVSADDDQQAMVFSRKLDDQVIYIGINRGDKTARLELPVSLRNFDKVYETQEDALVAFAVQRENTKLHLAPRTGVVLKVVK